MLRQQHAQLAIQTAPPLIHDSTIPETLHDIVLRHQVSYEVWPEWSGCGGRARRIGFCVSICGVNDRVDCVHGHHVPGCPHCSSTYDEIHKIAEWITLQEHPDCRFQIEPFDRAFHIASKQRWSRNEIVVTVKILHSHNVDGPVNEAQDHCLNELRAQLKKLGIREGIWQTLKGASQSQ